MSDLPAPGTGLPTNADSKPRKLKGTRVEVHSEFVEYLEKRTAFFQKKTGKKITVATLIMAGHSKEQVDLYLKHEEASLKPWQRKDGPPSAA